MINDDMEFDLQHGQGLMEQRAAAEIAQEAAMTERAFFLFFRKHPELANQANRGIFESYIGGVEQITPELLEEVLPQIQDRLAAKTPERMKEDEIKERGQLLLEIRKLLGGSEAGKESAITRLKWQPTEQIRQALEDLKAKKTLRRETPESLRAAIKNSKPAVEQVELPDTYNRESILMLDRSAFRKLCEDWGVVAVTRALNRIPDRKK